MSLERQRREISVPIRTTPCECSFQHSTKWWIAIIFSVGLIVRVSLILLTLHRADHARMDQVEPYLIATSLADKGTYADAFGSGTGPSAHTAPLLPMILLLIIRVVGGGIAGYLARSILAAIVSSAAYALLPALAVRCRLGLSPGVIAGFIGAAVPLNFFNQTAGDFDQPYTMLGLAGLCCLLGSDWARERFPLRGGMILECFRESCACSTRQLCKSSSDVIFLACYASRRDAGSSRFSWQLSPRLSCCFCLPGRTGITKLWGWLSGPVPTSAWSCRYPIMTMPAPNTK